MRAYLAIKYHQDQRNRDQIEKITDLLASHNVETVCIARDVEKWGDVKFTPQALMEISFAKIDTCDFVLIELSEKGVGLGIEAGYAYAQQIPIITLVRQGSAISMTLRGISSATYTYPSYEALDLWLAACPLITKP